MLRPSSKNRTFHARVRSKAKMFEYQVPIQSHINTGDAPLADMLDLAIGILGDFASGNIEDLETSKSRLLFTAQYFDSLLDAQVLQSSSTLLRLLSASAYYLSDYPGSSRVILESIDQSAQEDFSQMGYTLFSVLCRKKMIVGGDSPYHLELQSLSEAWSSFLDGQGSNEELDERSSVLSKRLYSDGSDEELLLGDVVRALILKQFSISAKNVLVLNSGSSEEAWRPYFALEGCVTELWPSQMRLAESGVFAGASAVVQMPTSAGKTRSIELIIRSHFLANRGNLAVVVAPYRALCQEIYNDFATRFSEDASVLVSLVSDVLHQEDFSFMEEAKDVILILTPEKLELLVRYNPELAETIGLIVYDEGHLFDDTSRGSKYELLLSSLKIALPDSAQVVLMSAVISNALEVSDWLLNQGGVVIDGQGLSPTSRNIAFVEWTRRNRNLQFVEERNIDKGLFFVPSVLTSYPLDARQRESKQRFFPDLQSNGLPAASNVSGFLACRLAGAGLNAIFVGQKASAIKIARDIVDAYDRNVRLPPPSEFSSQPDEAEKVARYISKIFGQESVNAKAARLGVLMHHAGIPHGLKLVTEYALLKSHFKVVVCTSTLAQGINLPIRYLIVSSMRQGKQGMKTRDFHNLMGRAGRSGWYTEGTVIFANPEIYKAQGYQGRKWLEIDYVLDSDNSEPSKSLLHLLLMDEEEIPPRELDDWRADRESVRKEITSYLLNALSDIDEEAEVREIAIALLQNTLGYSQLGSERDKRALTKIFVDVALDIIRSLPDRPTRLIFAKSFLTLEQSKEFVSYLQWHAASVLEILRTETNENLIDFFWEHLYGFAADKKIRGLTASGALLLCKKWISGDSFLSIHQVASEYRQIGTKALNMLDIISLCENGFGYEVSAILGSLSELSKIVLSPEDARLLEDRCYSIQKSLKFGVPGDLECAIYQLGFSDRDLSMEIAQDIGDSYRAASGFRMVAAIRNSNQVKQRIGANYPEYFTMKYQNMKHG